MDPILNDASTVKQKKGGPTTPSSNRLTYNVNKCSINLHHALNGHFDLSISLPKKMWNVN